MWSIGYGQDNLVLTLLVAYALYLASLNKEVPAGILLGFAAVKPHLLWALPLALLIGGRRKMLASLLITAFLLALVSFLVVGPRGVTEWISLLGSDTTDVMPQSMFNIRALGLEFGLAAGLIAACLNLGCFAIILRYGSFHQKISAAILTALLLSPHTYCQDLAFLGLLPFLTAMPVARYILVLPWPYFYPYPTRLHELMILLSLTYLAFIAGRLLAQRRRLAHRNLPDAPDLLPPMTCTETRSDPSEH